MRADMKEREARETLNIARHLAGRYKRRATDEWLQEQLLEARELADRAIAEHEEAKKKLPDAEKSIRLLTATKPVYNRKIEQLKRLARQINELKNQPNG